MSRSRVSLKLDIPIAREVARVDPTGVGDAYRAGFLAGLAWEVSLERCAQLGSLLASYAIEVVGTQEYRFGDTFLARFEDAYGAAAAAESLRTCARSPALMLGPRHRIGSARAEQPPYCSCRHCGRARSA